MEEMVRVKYLDIDLMPGMKKVWWYGYGESFARQMEGFVDLLFARGVGKAVEWRGAIGGCGEKREKALTTRARRRTGKSQGCEETSKKL